MSIHKSQKAQVWYDWEHMVWVPKRLTSIDAIAAQTMNRAIRLKYVGAHQ